MINRILRVRIPELDAPTGLGVALTLVWGRTVHFSNERRAIPGEKPGDLRSRRHEGLCQFSVRRVANDDEESNTVRDDGGQFVGLVADASVMRHAHPGPRGDQLQPLLVRAGRRAVIGMTLHPKAGLSQDRRELVA